MGVTDHPAGTGRRRLASVPDPDPETAAPGLPEVRVRRIHGHDRAYRRAGSGSTVVLLHGIGDSSRSWSETFGLLAEHHDVIAPDLLGHGQSDKPRADYSVGGFANGVRDLLTALGVERATIVGHSLGAGVAMQFAYQYPDRCERLVLVGAGGISRSVHPMLRAATLPTAPWVLGALRLPGVRRRVRQVFDLAGRFDTALGAEAEDVLRVLDGLPDREARMAFTRTLRAVVDLRGQVVTALDRTYLVESLPVLLVWGTRDPVIPEHHARLAQAALPSSRLVLFRGVGHFPHRADPTRFAAVVRDFVATSEPAVFDPEAWRARLLDGRNGEGNVTVLADRAEALEQ